MLCLVVAKIEKNYDNDDPNDVGFDVLWLLSPLFFVFGIVGFCCACLIYGAAPIDPSVLNEERKITFYDDVTDGLALLSLWLA